jgi:hypothetical protein
MRTELLVGTAQVPSVLENPTAEMRDSKGFSVDQQLAYAANAGVTASVNGQTVDQMLQSENTSITTSLSGAAGPFGLDVNRTGGAVAVGRGVGARFGFGPIFTAAYTVPICMAN